MFDIGGPFIGNIAVCGHVARLRSSRIHLTPLMHHDLPGLPPVFNTASNKNLRMGKAGYEATPPKKYQFLDESLTMEGTVVVATEEVTT